MFEGFPNIFEGIPNIFGTFPHFFIRFLFFQKLCLKRYLNYHTDFTEGQLSLID